MHRGIFNIRVRESQLLPSLLPAFLSCSALAHVSDPQPLTLDRNHVVRSKLWPVADGAEASSIPFIFLKPLGLIWPPLCNPASYWVNPPAVEPRNRMLPIQTEMLIISACYNLRSKTPALISTSKSEYRRIREGKGSWFVRLTADLPHGP